MRKSAILVAPAILASLLATIVLIPSSRAAGEQCLAKPNGAAPEGSHWYYRSDRTAGRPCWFLGPVGRLLVRHAWTPKRLPPPRPPLQQTKETPADVKADGHGMDAAFATRWPTLPRSASTLEHVQMSNSYAEEPQAAEAQVAEPQAAESQAGGSQAAESQAAEPHNDTPVPWPVATTATAPATESAVAEPAASDRSNNATGMSRRVLAFVGVLALLGMVTGAMLTVVDVRRRRRHRVEREPGDRARARPWPRPRELHSHPPRPQSQPSSRPMRGLAARL